MSRTFTAAALLSLSLALPLGAQQKPAPPKVKADKAAEMKKMQAEAKIPEATARTTALSKVAKGATVVSEELEREGGKLIYSYDLKVPGKSGVDEVHIDAITGAQVGKVEHESAKAEAKEMKKEAPKPPVKKTGK